MAKLTHIQTLGNQLKAIFDDGTSAIGYPTPTGMWVVSGGGTTPPPTGEDLVDFWTPDFTITEVWDEHASYSHGGTDWGMPVGTPLKASAPGNIRNFPNIDGAGLKTMLQFDGAYERKIAASTVLMNGDYYENPTATAVSQMFQHMSSQITEKHVETGDVIGYSGNTGDSTGPHLHMHLLAGDEVGSDRLDFMKFKG
jgi:murein DD-endopeptidase MepM/ murein hydrolase activator NlpD